MVAHVIEIEPNRAELRACFGENGLKVERSWTGLPYDVGAIAGQHSFAEAFRCVPEAGP